jgi:hypothetical protein
MLSFTLCDTVDVLPQNGPGIARAPPLKWPGVMRESHSPSQHPVEPNNHTWHAGSLHGDKFRKCGMSIADVALVRARICCVCTVCGVVV